MTTRKTTRYHSTANINSFCSANHQNKSENLNDISVEGLSFKSDIHYQPGAIVTIHIPIVVPSFRVIGEVAWCCPHTGYYDVGVKFIQVEKGFRIKTVEQLHFLEQYRKKVYFEEGRQLSCEEANAELVKQYRQAIN